MRRLVFALLLFAALFAGAAIAMMSGGHKASAANGSPSPAASRGASGLVGGVGTPAPSATDDGSGTSPSPSASDAPTPEPTPAGPVSPMDGRAVSTSLAARHPIAVMVDDHPDARPQSGFNQASVVYQAPAEGGIPRYMMLFDQGNPTLVGPVRSSRLYFIDWAAEWRAVYAHAGGSPQALATLKKYGTGTWVYNAEDFRWEGTYFHRMPPRVAPHNLYSNATDLRKLAARLGAKPIDPTVTPTWQFAPDAPLAQRPTGGTIAIARGKYLNVFYKYDRASNTYLRYVDGKRQVDAADTKPVAPKNVVIMVVKFGPLSNSNPAKGRLEAQDIGTGRADIFTNGKVVAGTWKKTSATTLTRFYTNKGVEITLTVGQTFVQVVQSTSDFKFTKGTPAGSTPGTGARSSPTPKP